MWKKSIASALSSNWNSQPARWSNPLKSTPSVPENLLDTGDAGSWSEVVTSQHVLLSQIHDFIWFLISPFLPTTLSLSKGSWPFHAFPIVSSILWPFPHHFHDPWEAALDAIRQGHERSATAQARSELYLGPGHDYYFISGPSTGCQMVPSLWV